MDEHLLRFNKKVKYAFVDFETYNLNLTFLNNRPWQTGILIVKGDQITETHNIITNWLNDDPNLFIEPEVAMMNHYNEATVRATGWTPEKSFEAIYPILQGVDYVVWHNGIKFDLYLFRAWCEEMGKDWKFIIPKMIDTKSLAQGLKMNILYDPKKDNFLEYQYRMANIIVHGVKTKLSILAKEYGIPFDVNMLHDAIYDLQVNKAVFDKMKMQVEI